MRSFRPCRRCSRHRQPAVDNVVVTGVRHAQTVDDSLASVTVIDRKQIEQSPAVDVIGLLAQQAGVDISRTGGPGQSSTIFLRGTNSNQTLVLIDGIRVASATQGVFDFAHLPLNQIERIEIVRGPRAAFWGSDAIGGVIQIFTRNPERLVGAAPTSAATANAAARSRSARPPTATAILA